MIVPPPFMASAVKTLTFYGSAHTSYAADGDTETVTMPAGIQAGDLCFFMEQRINSSGTPGDVTPSGFTQIATFATTSSRRTYSYKILNGTETTFPKDTTGPTLLYSHRLVLIFRGNVPVRSVTAGGAQFESTTGNPAAQIQTVSSLASPVIVIGFYAVGASMGVIPTRTMTPTKTGEVSHPTWTGSSTAMYLGYLIFNVGTTPSDTTVDMADYGTNYLGSCYLKVS